MKTTAINRPRERGNAFVEFALACSLMAPVLLGCFQFGYSFYLYNELQTAVRAGARYASLRTYNSATSTPANAYRTAVQNVVVYGNPDGAASPVVPGLARNNVNVTVTFQDGVPESVTISLQNFQLNAIFGNIQLNTKPRVTIPYVGRFDPLV